MKTIYQKNNNINTYYFTLRRMYVSDTDDCPKSNACQHNGTCMDLYHRYTCKCPHGYKPKDCSHSMYPPL